ncbi:hypothetical protein MMC24_002070 [Lignoscripta atroalba]|nr:hypothetical protein [Lignoscripta atroalba]
MAEDPNPELEKFRNQWREEVTARSKGTASGQHTGPERPPPSSYNSSLRGQLLAVASPPPAFSVSRGGEEENSEGLGSQGYHDLHNKDEARRLGGDTVGVYPSNYGSQEPRSALEHYEKAVEKETQGNLGDSLSHYRKAYRLDARVDQTYKNKHFPPSSFVSKPTNSNPSNTPVTVPNPAHHSLEGPPASTISQLIASFSSTSIEGIPPPTDHSPLPPCHIGVMPSEILIEVLLRTAVLDVASFARLSLVSKRLAYLVATEDRIWKRICLGSEVGFGAMRYSYVCTLSGEPLPTDGYREDNLLKDLTQLTLDPDSITPTPIDPFPLTSTYPTYRHMFRTCPRLRFNGCYISTVNYVRPGASSPTQISWNTPVHIVTYYRYLRFFRDGSCVSLLTTSEPADVVHYLIKEHMHNHHTAGSALPTAVMKNALRGRWRLSGLEPLSKISNTQPTEPEGDVHIETEGVDPKYMYKMHLSLKSGSHRQGATKNNKLVWRGFWSYNRLTDDWAEFGLRNDRAFFWSRVKSYGMGV